MSEQTTTEASGPDPDREVGPEAAAALLGFSVAAVRELAESGAIPARTSGDALLMRRGDVEAFRDRYESRRAAIRKINQIVDESPGGWDA